MPTYQGSCHCGAVRIAVEKAEPPARLIDCNCSICVKKGVVHFAAEPEELKVLRGEDEIETYRFNTEVAEHNFCRRCGIHVYSRPRNSPHRFSVNARCLDDYEGLRRDIEIVAFNGQNHPKDQA